MLHFSLTYITNHACCFQTTSFRIFLFLIHWNKIILTSLIKVAAESSPFTISLLFCPPQFIWKWNFLNFVSKLQINLSNKICIYSGLTLNQYGVASPCRTGLKLIHYKKTRSSENQIKVFRRPCRIFTRDCRENDSFFLQFQILNL